MSLNKFTAVDTGFNLELDIGCDQLKANNVVTDNIDVASINGQAPPSYQTYTPNFSVTEGALISDSPDISVLSIGNAIYLDGKVDIILPSNGALFFDLSFDIPGLYTVTPLDKSSSATGSELNPSTTFSIVKAISGIDIGFSPARYSMSLRKDNGSGFISAVPSSVDFHVVIESNEP
jgi:hypothetical protein